MSTNNNNADTSAADVNRPEDTTGRKVIYNFIEQGIGNWKVQDDVVMGGRSDSQIEIAQSGRLRFTGHVSLENNGGFCSFQQTVKNDPYVVKGKSAFALILKGDGKDYNFRVYTPNGRHAYGFTFPTKTGEEWETINIPFSAMEATFRGRSVDVPNYAGEDITGIQILIGNKTEQNFELVMQSIEVI